MKPKATLFLSITAAVVVGLGQTYALVAWSNWIAMHTSVPRWLVEHGLRGGAFRGAAFTFDFVKLVVLCIPAALLLVRLRPASLRVYLAAAVLPSFILLNMNVLEAPRLAFIAPAWALDLLPLPLAAWLIRRLQSGPPTRPASASSTGTRAGQGAEAAARAPATLPPWTPPTSSSSSSSRPRTSTP